MHSNREARPVRADALAIVSSSVLSTLIAVPTSILVARALGPELKGVVTLITMTLGYGIYVTSFGTGQSLLHLAGHDPDARKVWTGTALSIGVFGGLLAFFGGAVLVFTVFATRIPSNIAPLAVAVLATAPAAEAAQLLKSVSQGLGKILENGIIDVVTSAVFALGSVLVLATNTSAEGWLIVIVVTTMGTTLARTILGFASGMFPPLFRGERDRKKRAYVLGLRGYPGDLLHDLNNRIDVFLVAGFLSSRSLGLYAVAVAIVEFLLIVPRSLGVVILQRASSTARHEASAEVTASLTRLTSMVITLMSISILLFGSLAVRILFGRDFSGAASALAPLLPGVWALGTYVNLTSYLTGRGAFGARSIAAGIGTGVTLTACLILIPTFGIVGAGISSSLGYFGAMITSILMFRKMVGAGAPGLLIPQRGDVRRLWELLQWTLRSAIRLSVGRRQSNRR